MNFIRFIPAAVLGMGLLFSSCSPVKPSESAGSSGEVTNHFTITINGNNEISHVTNLFYGFNYWQWPKTWGAPITGTETTASNLNIRFLRAGGINNDVEFPDPVNNEMLSNFQAYCRSVGAEPLLQLPVASRNTLSGRIDHCSNIIVSFKKFYPNLKYVSIGNEPDGYASGTSQNADYNVPYLSGYTVQNVIADYNGIAAMIRSAFPGLTIIGLELGYTYGWVTPFVAGTKNNLDILSVHRYPLWPASSSTYDNAKADFDNITSFYNTLESDISSGAGGKHIPYIIGECNISADGDPSHGFYDASPGTFNSALWLADFIGISSGRTNLLSIQPWSIAEGWATSFTYADKTPKTNYYAYELFSKYSYDTQIHLQKLSTDVRIYAYKNTAGNLSVFIVNWNKSASAECSLNFTNCVSNQTLIYTVPAWSLTGLTFEPDGSGRKAYTMKNNGPLPWSESDW